MTVTIFTPTYNRAYILSNLYESLCKQTCMDFEWIVVDDGSTDNTRQLVTSYINANIINITYIYQENGGKQRAINRAVKISKSKLFFIVDSDDYLVFHAVEELIKAYQSVERNSLIAGFCFRRINLNTNEVIGPSFPQEEFNSDSLELVYKYGIGGDKAEVFMTDVLRRFPFPEIEGEKFVPEALCWNRIAAAGFKLHCIDRGIYYCEYLSDGYSHNFNINIRRNPCGFMMYYTELKNYRHTSKLIKLKAYVRILQCVFYQLLK